MYRPNSAKVFEPRNPEYALASSIDGDFINASSPLVWWWSVDRTATVASQDELDHIYGEKSSGTALHTFKDPNRVYLFLEINPILIELTRLGIEQIEEVTTIANVDDFLNRNHASPVSGDIFRVSYVVTDQEYRNVFYTVSSVVPFDIFNMKYLNWHIYAEQTPMAEVPQSIKDFIGYL
jgi:hypothetical protein